MTKTIFAFVLMLSCSSFGATMTCFLTGTNHDGKSFSTGFDTDGTRAASRDMTVGDYSFHVAASMDSSDQRLVIKHMEITDLKTNQASKLLNHNGTESVNSEISLFTLSGPSANLYCFVR